jgi:hypothetical protein
MAVPTAINIVSRFGPKSEDSYSDRYGIKIQNKSHLSNSIPPGHPGHPCHPDSNILETNSNREEVGTEAV